ncbi:MAG: Polyribonucleotide nucleotidyltransferase [Microgenomates bacterium OLB22]|nr:MAG: Polyribonucleotide nucleotidyltransferase [Microgenomates bacterium OLB22]
MYATLGDTAVLVTVAVGQEQSQLDYFPLTVDYVEKLYAGGIIKGSRWVKREGRPSDESILIGRLIDRSIRPLFPKSFRREVQVIITLLSLDGQNSPDILGALSTSLALSLSSIPWNGPIATTRIGYHEGADAKAAFSINPSLKELEDSSLDLVVSSTEKKVLMLETQATIVPDKIVQDGIEEAKKVNAGIVEFFKEVQKKYGKEKLPIPEKPAFEDINEYVTKEQGVLFDKMMEAAVNAHGNNPFQTELLALLKEKFAQTYDEQTLKQAIEYIHFKKVHEGLLSKKRPDGRDVDVVRDLKVERSILPRTHGSALFQRGQTQILSIVTLGSSSLEMTIEGPEGQESKRYMHHYSDGPYSYGQTGRMGSPSRRAIGHGALAEKAIEPVLPDQATFPYAIRVVSEILSENGSSSMGSVCGSSLALMDAGVPISNPVAGIAMGIVSSSDDDYVVLTDIIGLEDFSGEMDFKIAGTAEGITAIQLDVKNEGLTADMIGDIFAQSHKARLHILENMNAVISKASEELSPYAPKVVILTPPEDKIGAIIGPGGKMIKSIIAKTGAQIDIDDSGKVSISGVSADAVEEAKTFIEGIYAEIEKGKVYSGTVTQILPFGAVVEFMPGKDGLVHISKLGKGFVKEVSDVVKEGEQVTVRVDDVDPRGRISSPWCAMKKRMNDNKSNY